MYFFSQLNILFYVLFLVFHTENIQLFAAIEKKWNQFLKIRFIFALLDDFIIKKKSFSYDNDGTTRDEIKERFALTMEFVENYLRIVVCQNVPFSDKEKNKLTFEVSFYTLPISTQPALTPPRVYLTV